MSAWLAGTATAKLAPPPAAKQRHQNFIRLQTGRNYCVLCLGGARSRTTSSSRGRGWILEYRTVAVGSATVSAGLVAAKSSDTLSATLREKNSCEASSFIFEKNGFARTPEKELERRRKIADANRGRIPWNKGTPWTPDVKQKISERTKAAMSRPEIRDKLGQSVSSGRRGHSQSLETREKIRQSLKQRHLKKREDNIARLITEGLSREEAEFQLLPKREKTKIVNAKKREERRQQRELEAKAKINAAARRKEASLKRLDNLEDRQELSSRIYKSENHRRRISESIRRKWQEKTYREKVLTGIRSYFDNPRAERQPRAKTSKPNVTTDRMIGEGYRMSTNLEVDRELALRKAELRRKALALIAMKKQQLNAQR